MSIGLAFWLIFFICVILGVIGNWPQQKPWAPIGNLPIVFILLFLLGWAVFGFVIRE